MCAFVRGCRVSLVWWGLVMVTFEGNVDECGLAETLNF